MSKINMTKIIQTIQKDGELNFNNGDSIIKLESNCYIVKSEAIAEENNTAIFDLNELRYFIKEQSSIFIDIFDSAAYNKNNFSKEKTPEKTLEDHFLKEPIRITLYDKLISRLNDRIENSLSKYI